MTLISKQRMDHVTQTLGSFPTYTGGRKNGSKEKRHYYLREGFWNNPTNQFWEQKHPGEPRHSEASKDYFRSIYCQTSTTKV